MLALLPPPAGSAPVGVVLAALYVGVVFRFLGLLGGVLWLGIVFTATAGLLGEVNQYGVLVAVFVLPVVFATVRWRLRRAKQQRYAEGPIVGPKPPSSAFDLFGPMDDFS